MLLSSAAFVAGCAPRTLDECNPSDPGMFNYFQCTQQYTTRQDLALDRLQRAQQDYNREADQTRTLRAEFEQLSHELREVQGNVQALKSEHSQLEQRIAAISAQDRDVAQYADAIDAYLVKLDRANARVANYQPPPLPPAPEFRNVLNRLPGIQNEATQKRAKIRQARFDLTEAVKKFALGYITSEALKFLIEKILEGVGWEALNPYVGWAFFLDGLYEGWQTWQQFHNGGGATG